MPTITFLTGSRFWDMTAFCAWSLQQQVAEPLSFEFIDDGSLTAAESAKLLRILPGSRMLGTAEVDERLQTALPAGLFDALRRRRQVYPHLRKLTDAHAGRRGWRLVLDSDMLFFREPTTMLSWLRAPSGPLHMVDIDSYYGYSEALMQRLAGCPIPARVNVGVAGLRSEEIDWPTLQKWIVDLESAEGPQYLQEQALTAMLIARSAHAISLSPSDYRCCPSPHECINPSAALHHYVNEAKIGYFRHAWRKITR